MVAHKKPHPAARRKPRRVSRPARATRARAHSKRRARAAKKRDFSGRKQAPKARALANEEALKPREADLESVNTETESDELSSTRERERSGYDGDTAIKLYLRENRSEVLGGKQRVEAIFNTPADTKELKP